MSTILTNGFKLAFVSINITCCIPNAVVHGLRINHIYNKARIPLNYSFQKQLTNTFNSFQPQTFQTKLMKRSINEILPANSLRRSSRIRQQRTIESSSQSVSKSNEEAGLTQGQCEFKNISQKKKTKNHVDSKAFTDKTDRKTKSIVKPKKENDNNNNAREKKNPSYLPRERESMIMKKLMSSDLSDENKTKGDEAYDSCNVLHQSLKPNSNVIVIGIDEAGRGPLAGPVVAAAAFVPNNIPGIVDSKKITKETERERLFELIIASPDVRWAASFIDAERIDQINILQSTMEAMSKAAAAIMGIHNIEVEGNNDSMNNSHIYSSPCAKRKGSYIVSSSTNVSNKSNSIPKEEVKLNMKEDLENEQQFYALIDGNRVPSTMPCPAECIVKGDSKEYSIAAASIIAKVLRDRLMNEYDKLYPKYNLIQNKGYPTAAHMSVIQRYGATPIHRKTFAPLKNMKLDEKGKLISQDVIH